MGREADFQVITPLQRHDGDRGKAIYELGAVHTNGKRLPKTFQPKRKKTFLEGTIRKQNILQSPVVDSFCVLILSPLLDKLYPSLTPAIRIIWVVNWVEQRSGFPMFPKLPRQEVNVPFLKVNTGWRSNSSVDTHSAFRRL